MTYLTGLADVGPDDVAVAGGKAVGLGGLIQAGLPVPPGFVLTTAAYADFVTENNLATAIQDTAALAPQASPQDYEDASEQIRTLFKSAAMPARIATELNAAYGRLGGENAAVAVRSSATAEDLASASFAGQQETYLNVRGAEALAEAVIRCWASLWTGRAMAYRAREGVGPDEVRLAVVIQLMVEAEAAGVMFTANPANGRRDQTVISAAWGLGESVVSGTVTTDDVVVDAGTGTVVSRQTADKDVMTVYAENGTREQPVAADRRREPVLDDSAAAELAGYGQRITQHFGTPQDIEWARTADGFFILQSRPITALPDPAADTPDTWPLPYAKGLYFRASIVEQLPDPLSPLFADMVDGSVARSLQALLAEALGKNVIRDGDVGLPTINGYAYYYYRTSGMWRMMGKAPAAIGALARGKAHMGVAGWREFSHPRYERVIKDWSAKPPAQLTGGELLAGVQALLDAGTVYYTAVQSIIPLAATSELSFRAFYDKFVRRDGDPAAQTFLLGYDSEPIRAEKSLYDLAGWARSDPGLTAALLERPTAVLAECQRTGSAPEGVDGVLWQEWRIAFQEHLGLYGHAVYNLDFASPVAADDPSALLETVKFYLRGQGTDPHERQRLSTERREELTRQMAARLGPRRRAAFLRLLRWAQETAPIREDALADVGLAWPLLRRMLLELGTRLVASGVIAAADDVFWLRFQELRSAVEFGLPLFAMASAVVTDVGGPLSHSSIVAREYGIPAVLGTGVATQRLATGQQITVDGDAGTVTPERTAGNGSAPPASPVPRRWRRRGSS